LGPPATARDILSDILFITTLGQVGPVHWPAAPVGEDELGLRPLAAANFEAAFRLSHTQALQRPDGLVRKVDATP
jgi:hypothetical protein